MSSPRQRKSPSRARSSPRKSKKSSKSKSKSKDIDLDKLPNDLDWVDFRKEYRKIKGGSSSAEEYADQWEKYKKKQGYSVKTRRRKKSIKKKKSTTKKSKTRKTRKRTKKSSSIRKPEIKRSSRKSREREGNYPNFDTPSPCFPPVGDFGRPMKVSSSKDKVISIYFHYYHHLMSKHGEKELILGLESGHKSCATCLYYKDSGKLAIDPNSDDNKKLVKELKTYFKTLAKKLSKKYPEFEIVYKEVWFMTNVVGVSFDMKEFGPDKKIQYDKVVEKVNGYVEKHQQQFIAPKEREWIAIGPVRLTGCTYYG